MFQGFDACYDENSRVLILGSFPSVKSRRYGFYYGNKQNRFWKMLENVFEEKIGDDIESKKLFLKKHHIALYDAVTESNLTGSADESLIKSKIKLADLSFLLPPNTKVEKILCNGKAAYTLVAENLETGLDIIYMPSTSPANVSFKYDVWEQGLNFLKK